MMAPVKLLEPLGRPPAVAALAGEDAVYVVGGAVRDLLLGRVPRELDFVVEGDAVAVARRAAARLGGRVLIHERFGTATVSAPDVVFDLAGARRERYERPGALPEVELGASLRDDLRRRDFTVNAIALRLVDGRLVALGGALADLEAGLLRVLHERSFLDDPTRLLRLARYGARLGFAVEPETDALAAAAVADGAVDTVTGPRLGAELRLLLGEPQPAALVALERHGLGRAVLGRGFAAGTELVTAAIDLCPPDARPDLAALAVTLAGWEKRAELSARLDRLEFTASERGIVAPAASGAHFLCDALEPESDDEGPLADVDLWRMLHRKPPEAVAVAGALGRGGPAEDAARRWLDHVRHRRLAIDGHVLVAAGLSGPPVGEALDAATVAMLEGRARTRDEQLAAALEAVGAPPRREPGS
jgi:tRNA nucleotidyltransferase (CCA-adding enzyme)